MRAAEFIQESQEEESHYLPMPLRMSNYRGSYDPRTMEPYPEKYQDNAVLAGKVEQMIAAGVEPQVTVVDPRLLRATQDWLSTEGGGDPLFPEYADLPVVLKMPGEFGQLLVLDGHHRSSRALQKGQKIRVYLFDTNLKENFADGRVKGKSRPGRVKRAGASCAGSVTDLRARAKKYSGERAKMYHWCANMKAGKKK